MDILLTGLKVALIGMLIVFFGLTILIGLIKVLTTVTDPSRKEAKKAAKAAASAQTTENTEEETEEITAEDDGALVAAITAAIVSVLGTENRFTVRHIRRIAR